MRRSLAMVLALSLLGCAKDSTPTVPLPTFLSPETANHVTPSLSPDGKRIAWWQAVDGAWQLWLADAGMANAAGQEVRSPFSASQVVWSRDGSRLATMRLVAGRSEIVVLPAAGGTAEVVHVGTGLAMPTSWDASGTRIAMLETFEGGAIRTRVVETATRGVQPLLLDESRPHVGVFAPTGSRIAVMLLDRGRYTLSVLDSLGAAPRPLTTEGYEVFAGNMPWSPDGRELLYASTRTGAEDLWVVNVESGATRQLTNDLRRDYTGWWSPGGKWIAFQSERGRQADLWVVPAAGGDARRVTDSPELENLVGWNDDQSLTYVVSSGTGSFHAVPLAGGAERQLTPDSIRVSYFELSPDGTQAAVTDFRGGSDLTIYLTPTDGGPSRFLAKVQASDPRVLWAPDGKHLAFVGTASGTLDPWVVEVATGTVRQLLDWSSYEANLIWGNDPGALYVISDRDAAFGDVWRVPLDGAPPVRVSNDGRLNDINTTLDGGTSMVVTVLGGEGGRFGIAELTPDGVVRPIPTSGNVDAVAWNTPAGSDSLVVTLDGGQRTMLVSRRDGGGRQLSGEGGRANYWSRDGKWLAFNVGAGAGREIEVLEVATGTRRRLTNGGGSNVGAEFSRGSDTVFFRRNVPISRVAVSDLRALLDGGR